MIDNITVEEALEFLKNKGYRLNKAKQYEEDVIYLIKKKHPNGRLSFGLRRSPEPVYNYKSKSDEVGVAKINISKLDWETYK